MKGAGFVSVIASIYICAVYTTVYSFLKQAPKRFNINSVLRILSKNKRGSRGAARAAK